MFGQLAVSAPVPKRRPGRPRKNPLNAPIESSKKYARPSSESGNLIISKRRRGVDSENTDLYFSQSIVPKFIPPHLPPPVQPATRNRPSSITENLNFDREFHEQGKVSTKTEHDDKTNSDSYAEPEKKDIIHVQSVDSDDPTNFDESNYKQEDSVGRISSTDSSQLNEAPPMQGKQTVFNAENQRELLSRCSSGSASDRRKKILEYFKPVWREQLHNYRDVARSLEKISIYKDGCEFCHTSKHKLIKDHDGNSAVPESERWDHIFVHHFSLVKPLHCLFCTYESCLLHIWRQHSLECGAMNGLLESHLKPTARRNLKSAIAEYLEQKSVELFHSTHTETYKQSETLSKHQRLDALVAAYKSGGATLEARVEGARKYAKGFWDEQWSEYKRALAWVFQSDSIATRGKTCGECDRTYVNSSELNTHRLVIHHRNIMPMQCFFCDRRYCIKKSLRTHADTLHSVENITNLLKEKLGEGEEAAKTLGSALHASWKRGRATE